MATALFVNSFFLIHYFCIQEAAFANQFEKETQQHEWILASWLPSKLKLLGLIREVRWTPAVFFLLLLSSPSDRHKILSLITWLVPSSSD
jgi:hypothetical protein